MARHEKSRVSLGAGMMTPAEISFCVNYSSLNAEASVISAMERVQVFPIFGEIRHAHIPAAPWVCSLYQTIALPSWGSSQVAILDVNYEVSVLAVPLFVMVVSHVNRFSRFLQCIFSWPLSF